jgi:CHAD domain-containing protein
MTLDLAPGTRERLLELSNTSPDDPVRRRAQILLLYNEGKTTAAIGDAVRLSQGQVRYWRRRFQEEGMSIFPLVDGPSISSPPMDRWEREAVPLSQVLESGARDRALAETVRNLALTLFDGMTRLHGLGESERKILEWAALLHNFKPADADARNAHRAAAEILEDGAIAGMDDAVRQTAAALIRYLKGKPKTGRGAEGAYGGIAPDTALLLLSFLRLAVALSPGAKSGLAIEAVRDDPDAVRVLLSGKEAAALARRAQAEAALFESVERRSLLLIPKATGRRTGEQDSRLPLPKPAKSTGLQPWDPIPEAGRKVLRRHFAEMIAKEAGTRTGSDIEDLHDMRVAVRRMRVALGIFEEFFSRKALRRHLSGLRRVGSVLGRVRDLDVSLERAEQFQGSLPEGERAGLAPLFRTWGEQRQKARAEMLGFLDSPVYGEFVAEFNLFVSTTGADVRKRYRRGREPLLVRHAAPSMIYQMLAAVRAYEGVLAEATLEQLHALRIEFKRLRYTLEYFREVLGDPVVSIIQDIKTVQDHLGNLNDADVTCRTLSGFLRNWEVHQQQLPLIDRENPEPIVRYLAAKHAERHELMVSFRDTWAKFIRPEVRRMLAEAVAEL